MSRSNWRYCVLGDASPYFLSMEVY